MTKDYLYLCIRICSFSPLHLFVWSHVCPLTEKEFPGPGWFCPKEGRPLGNLVRRKKPPVSFSQSLEARQMVSERSQKNIYLTFPWGCSRRAHYSVKSSCRIQWKKIQIKNAMKKDVMQRKRYAKRSLRGATFFNYNFFLQRWRWSGLRGLLLSFITLLGKSFLLPHIRPNTAAHHLFFPRWGGGKNIEVGKYNPII